MMEREDVVDWHSTRMAERNTSFLSLFRHSKLNPPHNRCFPYLRFVPGNLQSSQPRRKLYHSFRLRPNVSPMSVIQPQNGMRT